MSEFFRALSTHEQSLISDKYSRVNAVMLLALTSNPRIMPYAN